MSREGAGAVPAGRDLMRHTVSGTLLCLACPGLLVGQVGQAPAAAYAAIAPGPACAAPAMILGGITGAVAGGFIGAQIERALYSGSKDAGITGLGVGVIVGAFGGIRLAQSACGSLAGDSAAPFESVEGVAPAEDRGRSRGAAWGDYDCDGDPDLFVTRATYDASVAPQGNVLYRNEGDGRFSRVDAAPTTDRAGDFEGAVWVDIDNDGDLDLFVANCGSLASRNRLYRNTAPAGSWIKVRLEGVRSNRMGVGARVSVLAAVSGEPRWQHRWLDAATGYAGQNEPVLHFGLGTATRVDSLLVRWPSGALDRMRPLPVGIVHTVREGGG